MGEVTACAGRGASGTWATGVDDVPCHACNGSGRASTTPSGEVEGLEDWDIETTAEGIARKHSQYKGGRLHADWYGPAKAAALEALVCARNQRDKEFSTALASMKREVERLTSMLEGMLPVSGDGDFVFIDGPGDVEIDHGGKLRSRAEAAEARIQVLEEALKPFADYNVSPEGDGPFCIPGDHPLLGNGFGNDWRPIVYVKHFRSASQALGRK